MAKSRKSVRIEGYADRDERGWIESHPGPYEDTWQLSTDRARRLAKRWIKDFEMAPSSIAIVGYGHYRPLKVRTNDESERKWKLKRGSNRRLEFVLLK